MEEAIEELKAAGFQWAGDRPGTVVEHALQLRIAWKMGLDQGRKATIEEAEREASERESARAAWLARFERADWIAPWDTAGGMQKGDSKPGERTKGRLQ